MSVPGFGVTVLASVFSETFDSASKTKFRALQSHGRRHARALKRVANCLWSKTGANALLAVKCCIENMRWPDFLKWRACCVAAA